MESDSAGSRITFAGVSKTFRSREGEVVPAVADVGFSVRAGSIVCLLGPTGCGKSTILRLAAGLEEPEAGRIELAPDAGGDPRPAIGYLTQRHTLLPWLTARENISLPLRLRGEQGERVRDRSGEILESLGLADHAGLYPYEMSGGMQQRTAMGRLLASEAGCWLLDEPFASLDERTRHRLQDLLLELVRNRNMAVLFVTHSIDEAVYLADGIHVFSTGPGRIVETLDLDDPKPRQRLSDSFGGRMERIRKILEEVICR